MSLIIPQYEVELVHKKMTSGRNSTFSVQCIDNAQSDAGSYVLKLSSKLLQNGGLQNELIASQLAKKFNLPTPKPAILNVSLDLANALKNTAYDEVGKSIGLNFGSELLTPGYNIWPVSAPLPPNLENLGGEILAFDAFIQNLDRRNNNPNILQNGNEIMLIDHEMAFSFTVPPLIGTVSNPWEEEAFKACIVQKSHCHAFYSQLRGKGLQFDGFKGKLNSLTDEDFAEIMDCVPIVWKTPKSPDILKHLKELRNNADKFILNLRRVMS
jgi:hypothetical protein